MTEPSNDYYKRPEISNSMLTEIYYKLYPTMRFVSDEALQKAYRLGNLVDALITEPTKINYYRRTVDSEVYTAEEFKWGNRMKEALLKYAKKDKFIDYVLKHSEMQKVIVNQHVKFHQGCFDFELPCRCRFDFYLGTVTGDLKTTSATTYSQFLQQYRDIWLRGRVFYMELNRQTYGEAYGAKDFVVAISKKNQKVFFLKIERGDELFNEGIKKLNEIAFKCWSLMA